MARLAGSVGAASTAADVSASDAGRGRAARPKAGGGTGNAHPAPPRWTEAGPWTFAEAFRCRSRLSGLLHEVPRPEGDGSSRNPWGAEAGRSASCWSEAGKVQCVRARCRRGRARRGRAGLHCGVCARDVGLSPRPFSWTRADREPRRHGGLPPAPGRSRLCHGVRSHPAIALSPSKRETGGWARRQRRRVFRRARTPSHTLEPRWTSRKPRRLIREATAKRTGERLSLSRPTVVTCMARSESPSKPSLKRPCGVARKALPAETGSTVGHAGRAAASTGSFVPEPFRHPPRRTPRTYPSGQTMSSRAAAAAEPTGRLGGLFSGADPGCAFVPSVLFPDDESAAASGKRAHGRSATAS